MAIADKEKLKTARGEFMKAMKESSSFIPNSRNMDADAG
jgi:hypothetical protein